MWTDVTYLPDLIIYETVGCVWSGLCCGKILNGNCFCIFLFAMLTLQPNENQSDTDLKFSNIQMHHIHTVDSSYTYSSPSHVFQATETAARQAYFCGLLFIFIFNFLLRVIHGVLNKNSSQYSISSWFASLLLVNRFHRHCKQSAAADPEGRGVPLALLGLALYQVAGYVTGMLWPWSLT